MKINLTEYDLKTLEEKPSGWTYTIKTKTGNIVGSEIATKEALKHAEETILRMIKKMLLK